MFVATDTGCCDLAQGDPDPATMLDRCCTAPKRLELKVGAHVVLLKRLRNYEGFANGSRGVVVSFKTSTFPGLGKRHRCQDARSAASCPSYPVVRFGSQNIFVRPTCFEVPLHGGSSSMATRTQVRAETCHVTLYYVFSTSDADCEKLMIR